MNERGREHAPPLSSQGGILGVRLSACPNGRYGRAQTGFFRYKTRVGGEETPVRVRLSRPSGHDDNLAPKIPPPERWGLPRPAPARLLASPPVERTFV